jgi:hypothetical protein
MTFSHRARRRWLKRVLLGLAALALAAPAVASARPLEDGPHPAAAVTEPELAGTRSCRPPVGCPSSVAKASRLGVLPPSTEAAATEPVAIRPPIQTPGIDWPVVGIASGASVALLLAILAYTAISRKRAAADA